MIKYIIVYTIIIHNIKLYTYIISYEMHLYDQWITPLHNNIIIDILLIIPRYLFILSLLI